MSQPERRPAVVQRLGRFQKAEMLDHFCALPDADLRLRFGAGIGRSALERYVREIDFTNDRVFGIYDADLKLAGLAHLAVDKDREMAELGLSVIPAIRRSGHGEALLRRAATHASSLGLHTIYMHCLSENGPLMALARKAGFKIVASHGEADATRPLEASRPEGIAMELENDRIALVDSIYLHQAKLLRSMTQFGAPAPTV